MTSRRAFARGLAAGAVSALVGVSPADAETIEPAPKHPMSAETQRLTAAIAVVVATQLLTRTVWRPPDRFPGFAPIAYYVGHDDPAYPRDRIIWLNPDHPELVSPRRTHLGDDTPLIAELLLASLEREFPKSSDLGLRGLEPDKRRTAAVQLAGRIAVVAQFTLYPTVEDVEFERRGFAFAVLRQMTPGIGGVAPLPFPGAQMPAAEPLAYYAGRDVDARAPRGWGVIYLGPAAGTAAGREAYARAFVLATADRAPATSDEKRAYDNAAAQDAARGGSAARRAFAAPYLADVQALFGS